MLKIFLIIVGLGIASYFLFFQNISMPTFITAPTPTQTITQTPTITPAQNYTLEYSEGSCTTDSDCQWAGKGCGGGHGVCTNNPKKYEGVITTCEVNRNFPSNQGYMCGCVSSENRCGWKK